jgi:hypothetical protein
MADWLNEINADLVDLLDGYVVAEPEAKVSKSMTKTNEDYLPDQVAEILAKMSPQEQGVMSQFLNRVMSEQDRLRKSASGDFLNTLKRYFEEYLAELAAMPVRGTDPVGPETPDAQFSRPKTPNPHPDAPPDRPHTSKAAIRSLAKALMERLVRSRPDLMVVEQDDRGLVRNPARDAREDAARRDMRGERMVKEEFHEEGMGGHGVLVPQDDAEEEFGYLAQKRRGR